MKIATKITLLRILLVIPFAIFLLQKSGMFIFAALIVFGIASLTDYLDGKIARSRNEVTDLGKFLDPLADKLFISSAFIIFLQFDELSVPSWAVILIISREFIINGLRMLAASKGKIIAASSLGKIKTVSQIIAVLLILFILLVKKFEILSFYIILITTIITLYSGIVYLVKNSYLFTED